MEKFINNLLKADCVKAMNSMDAGCVDLVFADPPFNIKYDYDVYEDSLEYGKYIGWSAEWIEAVYRVLKPDGTFWLAIGDDYAAELKMESLKQGFHCRSWVIWYYTFGVHCTNKFSRSHTHLFYFVKDRDNFTFLSEEPENRIPSARELVYNDRRANSKGRLPDDTWAIPPADTAAELLDDRETFHLRPQDTDAFKPTEDTWYIPRVAGTFRERAGFHGCQMPEQLLGRIIRTCSRPGELVLDPFAGSATTLAVAAKLGRKFLGFDISENYVNYGLERLMRVKAGDPLEGSPEPTKSAPRTSWSKGKTRLATTFKSIKKVFADIHDGYSADRVIADPHLDEKFIAECKRENLPGDARTWNMLLFRLRKSGKLSDIDTSKKTSISWQRCEQYLFASEIAWQTMLNENMAESLDEILCDPVLAEEFDTRAGQHSPGYSPFEYRWAALKIRKQARAARSRAAVLMPPSLNGHYLHLDTLTANTLPGKPGVYIISDGGKILYVGETADLSGYFSPEYRKTWKSDGGSVKVQTFMVDIESAGRLAWQSCMIGKLSPVMNCFELHPDK